MLAEALWLMRLLITAFLGVIDKAFKFSLRVATRESSR
jgi:hypothetical protein